MRLLVLNCHEPWIYQLRYLDADLDVVLDLPGRKVQGWDARMRPFPARGCPISLEEAHRRPPGSWDAVLCHNITDLLDTAAIVAPKLLLLHESLDGRMAQQGATFPREEMIANLRTYLARIGGHAVGVTAAKARSWGITADPVHCSADPAEYVPPTWERSAGIRVANHVTTKRVFLDWDFHEAAFGALPITLVGHNPELGIGAAEDWDHLKRMFSEHRYYVHTADPRYEDGFNMAMVEAMAAGLPVITNLHPTSPITHGLDGFVAATPAEACAHAARLMQDRALAERMGRAAQETVRRQFSTGAFARGLGAAIVSAMAVARSGATHAA